MKKSVLFIGIIASFVFLFSCTEQYKQEIERLSLYADSLKNIEVEKDTTVMSYIRAFNAIQHNLEEIKMKERLITELSMDDMEQRVSKEQEINRDINAIYELLLENRKTLEQLRKQLNVSGQKNVELERMIVNLNTQIEQKDKEITTLKHVLANRELTIENLEQNLDAIQSLSEERALRIEEQTMEQNTVWYIIGTKKYLEEQGVVAKEGGIIGIGRSRKMSETFDPSLFTRADQRDLVSLPIFGKKARLISIHPAASYEFIGEKSIDSLRILFPDDFWSASRYLVVMID